MLRIFSLFIVALFTACSMPPIAVSADNSRTSLDWTGTYQGLLLCADCEGIQTVIELINDHDGSSSTGHYRLTQHHLKEGNTEVSHTSGVFQWQPDGLRISLFEPEQDTVQLKVEENQLRWLAQNGQVIQGDLTENYRLQKVADNTRVVLPIAGIHWQLTEINGVSTVDQNQLPTLLISPDGRASGFGGCNRYAGDLNMTKAEPLFGPLMSTRRACIAATLEPEFFATLAKVDRFVLTQANELHVINAQGQIVLRFAPEASAVD